MIKRTRRWPGNAGTKDSFGIPHYGCRPRSCELPGRKRQFPGHSCPLRRQNEWLAIGPRAANELNGLRAHENPSHTAIAIRPANARYQIRGHVGLSRSETKCGMTV